MALCAMMTSFPLLQIFSNKKKDGKNGKNQKTQGPPVNKSSVI